MAQPPTAPTTATTAPPSVRIEPAPATWPELIERSINRDNTHQRKTFRRELGLPTERPIVMTGHQLEFFHPGVLAKYIAAQCAAARLNADVAWIGVDQDDNDPGALSVPEGEIAGSVRRREAHLAGEPAGIGVPVAMLDAFEPEPPDSLTAPLASVTRGLARIVEALRRNVRANDAADQMIGALTDLMTPIVSPAPTVRATALSKTTLFREIIERMLADPEAAIGAYNRAVESHPDAGVRTLPVGHVLPLWVLSTPHQRMRARIESLRETPVEHLAPQGLLMSGLLRLAGADLFIHGLGGAEYDKITEEWFTEWLGVDLAPMAMVTADLRLPLPGSDLSPAEAKKQIWRAHHARHDPRELGDDAAHARKKRLLEDIERARSEGADPSPAFQAMQDALRSYREAHAKELEALDQQARRARAAMDSQSVIADRTWAFPLHDEAALTALRDEIAARFGF